MFPLFRGISGNMTEEFKIGLVAKPQGVRGELKIQPLTDNPARFFGLKEVLIDGIVYKILSAKSFGGQVIIALSGVNDRNAAENFRGKFLCVKREDAVELNEGEYFIADVIGCEFVTDEGKTLGTVTDVTSAKTDIFTAKTSEGKIFRFPFLKDAVVSVDIEKRIITVKSKRFSEIVLYED